MDVLADVIELFRLRSHFFGRWELTAPWGFEVEGKTGFLSVYRGSCWLEGEGKKQIPLAGGDFVFLSAGQRHTFRSSPDVPVRPITEQICEAACEEGSTFSFGGGGALTSLAAGSFHFEAPESDMLVDLLPPMIHIQGTGGESTQWLQSTLQFIAAESIQDKPGASAIISRLLEVLFVQALRTHITGICPPHKVGWLPALADPQIASALRRMHSEPGVDWTVPKLAREASMSRSAFAARFKSLVGAGPLEHLTQWRMLLAAKMLRNEPAKRLLAVASAVGYESESAFSKAFRREMHISPGEYRRKHLNVDVKQTSSPAEITLPAAAGRPPVQNMSTPRRRRRV